MKIPMAILAFLALIAGIAQIPGIDASLTNFPQAHLRQLPLYAKDPSTGASWVGLIIRGLIAVAGIGTAYVIYLREAGHLGRAAPGALRRRVHRLLSQQVVLR